MDTKEIALRWLNENLSYVDSVTVVDSTGRIIAKQRFNPRYAEEENREHNQWALGKNLLEVRSSTPARSFILKIRECGISRAARLFAITSISPSSSAERL